MMNTSREQPGGGVSEQRGAAKKKQQQQKKTREGSETIHINWPLIKIDLSQGKTKVLFDPKVLSLSSWQLQNRIHEVSLATLWRHFGCTGIFCAKLAESTRD